MTSMMSTADQSAVWRKHSNQWQKVGPPLRPCARDGEMMMTMALPVLHARNTPNTGAIVAVLGVTPEIVRLPWPDHVFVHAFDQSAEMIGALWQPHPHVPSTVTQARWQELPLENQSIRLAVGDASLNALPRLSDYPQVLSELARVLETDGLLCVRAFIRPNHRETMEAIAKDALAGSIRSFHTLKWRVAMSLSEEPEYSVGTSDILGAFEAAFSNRRVLARAANWPLDVIDTIDAYRGASTRYNFPTVSALQEICAPWFFVDNLEYADYELGERCPTASLRGRAR